MYGCACLIVRILAVGGRGDIGRITVCLLPRDIEIDCRALFDRRAGLDILGDHKSPVVGIGVNDRPDIACLEAESIESISRFLLGHSKEPGHLHLAGHVRADTDSDRHIRAAVSLHIPFRILAYHISGLDFLAAGFRDIYIKSCFCQKIDSFIPGKSDHGRDPRSAVSAYRQDHRCSHGDLRAFLDTGPHYDTDRKLVGFLICKFGDQSFLHQSGSRRRSVNAHDVGHNDHLFGHGCVIALAAARQDPCPAADDHNKDHAYDGHCQDRKDRGDPVHGVLLLLDIIFVIVEVHVFPDLFHDLCRSADHILINIRLRGGALLPVLDSLLDLFLLFVSDHARAAHIVGVIALYKISVRIADRHLEVRSQLLHILVAPVRALLTAFENDLVHAVGNIGIDLARRRHRLLDMTDRDRYRRLAVKRHFSRQHLIECHAQRVDIALLVAETAPGLFGRGIMNGSHDIGSDRITGSRLRDSEVRYLYLSVPGNNDILRFDIPVDDMVPVRDFKAHGNLQGDRNGFLVTEPSPLCYIILESDPVHQFHYDVVDALFLAYVVNIDDIGVHQACCRLRLYTEFRYEIGVLRKLLLEHLDRHIAVQSVIFGFIYICHTAGPDFFKDLVAVCDQHTDLNHVLPPLPRKTARTERPSPL